MMKTVLYFSLPVLAMVSYIKFLRFNDDSIIWLLVNLLFNISTIVLTVLFVFLPGMARKAWVSQKKIDSYKYSVLWVSFFITFLLIPFGFWHVLWGEHIINFEQIGSLLLVFDGYFGSTKLFPWIIFFLLGAASLSLIIRVLVESNPVEKNEAGSENLPNESVELFQFLRLYRFAGFLTFAIFVYILYLKGIVPGFDLNFISAGANDGGWQALPEGFVFLTAGAFVYFLYVSVLNILPLFKKIHPYPIFSQVFHVFGSIFSAWLLLSDSFGVRLSGYIFAALLLSAPVLVFLNKLLERYRPAVNKKPLLLLAALPGLIILSLIESKLGFNITIFSLLGALFLGRQTYSLIQEIITTRKVNDNRRIIIQILKGIFFLISFLTLFYLEWRRGALISLIGKSATLGLHITMFAGAYFISALIAWRAADKSDWSVFLKSPPRLLSLALVILGILPLIFLSGKPTFDFNSEGLGKLKLGMDEATALAIMGSPDFIARGYNDAMVCYGYLPVRGKSEEKLNYNRTYRCLLTLIFKGPEDASFLGGISVKIRLTDSNKRSELISYAVKSRARVTFEGKDLLQEREFGPEDFLKLSKLLDRSVRSDAPHTNLSRGGAAYFRMKAEPLPGGKYTPFLYIVASNRIKSAKRMIVAVGMMLAEHDSLPENRVYRPGILNDAVWLSGVHRVKSEKLTFLKRPAANSRTSRGKVPFIRGMKITPILSLKSKSRYKNQTGNWFLFEDGWAFSSEIGHAEKKYPVEFYGEGQITNSLLKETEKENNWDCNNEVDYKFNPPSKLKTDIDRLTYFDAILKPVSDGGKSAKFRLNLIDPEGKDKLPVELPAKYKIRQLGRLNKSLKRRLLVLKDFSSNESLNIKLRVFGEFEITAECKEDTESEWSEGQHRPYYDSIIKWTYRIDHIEYEEPARLKVNGLSWSPDEHVLLLNAGVAAQYCKKMEMRLPTTAEFQAALEANSNLNVGGKGARKLFWVADAKPFNAAGETIPEGESAPGTDAELGVRCVR